ncbi:hypothetical protein FM037_21355 [Shewanella psychropiezotolerans]|uniref:Uncharacterized protein n=1 Tax=Shewanella psychropiezotolerans TaxID=2593655 RepID=A0ABX5X1W0_9GAMM|nr:MULTISPECIES: TapY2 family type IVa secretion system protein [Shewanella]MPY20995.1 hypothetical protein [Shewanella sp. YLB-07]MPY21782.1 hypothetical protein [Shewanella sp. YLB-07]QDO85325.1 hypothetical protein FM037_21355 [Shewanella psychropiezotolerans]
MNKSQLTYLIFSFIAFALLVNSSSVNADDKKAEKLEYKCYLKTTKGYEIAFYRWEVKNFTRNMAKLPSRKLPGKRIYIKDVEECVELDASFTLGAAQKLDEETAR